MMRDAIASGGRYLLGSHSFSSPRFPPRASASPHFSPRRIWKAYDIHNFIGCPWGSGCEFVFGCLAANPGCPCLLRKFVAERHGIKYHWLDVNAILCPTLAWAQAANEAITRGMIRPLMASRAKSGAPDAVSISPGDG